ncbi:MAG: 50S ribosomal protein L22 [Planctomycetaceae bacterium]|nr:50S ribosomal protein L22 [Planctomycetaceae bacterium]
MPKEKTSHKKNRQKPVNHKRASHRYARISARKVRPLADLIRDRMVQDAIDILRYQPHRGARILEKVLKSALANATNPDLAIRARGGPDGRKGVLGQSANEGNSVEDLYVKTARVDEGPMVKRIRPRARGMAYMILKRTSHIHVELELDPNE